MKNIPEKENNKKNNKKNEKYSREGINIFDENEVNNCEDIGNIFRIDRKQRGMTQESIAGLTNIGKRFISELENGKPTMQIDKVFKTLIKNGFKITISKRRW